jgi:uncharacterized membrane protein
MENYNELSKKLEYFSSFDENITLDNEKLVEFYNQKTEKESILIKIVSVLGGLMSCGAVLGLLSVFNVLNSSIACTSIGLIAICVSLFINIETEQLFIESISASSFITGFVLIGFGLNMTFSESITFLMITILGIISLFFIYNYLLSFISNTIILLFFGFFIQSLNIKYIDLIYNVILTLLLFIVFTKETKLLTLHRRMSIHLTPLRLSIIINLIYNLLIFNFITKTNKLDLVHWIHPTCNIILILIFIDQLVKKINLPQIKPRFSILAISTLILFTTVLSPGISTALLIMLLSFNYQFKTGLVLGIISLIYFIILFYYNLNFNLLTKSIFLISSGILFLICYFLIEKKLKAHEKI